MINLYEGQITQVMPANQKNLPEVQAISYAVNKATQRIMDKVSQSMVYAGIDQLPEQLLDVLAIELQSLYYEPDLSIEVKRGIIKNTLYLYSQAGTPAAVEELVKIVFGKGSVVEWFDFNEPPYTPGTFDIVTNAQMTEEMATYFVSIIQRAKNVRSHIRRVLIDRDITMDERVAVGVHTQRENAIFNHRNDTSEVSEREFVGASAENSSEGYITNSPQGRAETLIGTNWAAVGLFSCPEEFIENHASPGTVSAGQAMHAAAMAYASTETLICNG